MENNLVLSSKKHYFWNPWVIKVKAFLLSIKGWTNSVTLSDILKLSCLFWPAPIIIFARKGLHFSLISWFDAQVAWVIAAYVPVIILFLTIILRGFKYSKTLSILVATISCSIIFYQNASNFILFVYRSLPKEEWFQFMLSVIQSNRLWLLAQVLLLTSMIWTCRYLWVKRGFRNFLRFRLWSFFDRSTVQEFRWLREPLSYLKTKLQGIVKATWLYSFILSFWPVLIIYLGFYKSSLYYAKATPMFNHLIAGTVPLVVALTVVILHFIKIGSIPSIVIAIVGNLTVGIHKLLQVIYYIEKFIPKNLNLFDSIKFCANLNWPLIWFDLFPFIVVLLLARYCWSQSNFRKGFKLRGFKLSINFGTAKFADLEAIQKINYHEGIPIGAMPKGSDFKNPQTVVENIKKYGGNEIIRLKSVHTTLVAPSGSGKGVGVVIPTLLEYPGPVFVTDIKGENYTITKRARALKGPDRKIIAFDPFKITESPQVRINPLDFLDPNYPEVVDDAQTLANLICPIYDQDGTNASYFQSQGATVIQCLLLYVACSDEVPSHEKNLTKIYKLLCLKSEELLNILSEIGNDKLLAYGSACDLANRIFSTDPRELSGILNSAFKEMKFISTPCIQDSTSCSDILLSDITKGNMDLFVCIPPDKLENQSRLLRLITGITFLEMQKAQGKTGPYNLLMVLDEMPALGHMKQIEQMEDYGRGYGVSVMAISQTIEAICRVYPKSWKTFFSNQLSIFFGCSESSTSKFVSEKIGQKTIETNSMNLSSGKQSRSMELIGTSSTQISDSISETGRPLMMKEEVEKLGNRVVLAFYRDDQPSDPIICQRIDYRERPEWKGLWDENPLHANRKTYNRMTFKEYSKTIIQVLMN